MFRQNNLTRNNREIERDRLGGVCTCAAYGRLQWVYTVGRY